MPSDVDRRRSRRRTSRSRPARSAQLPAPPGQQLNATVTAQSAAAAPPSEFRDIIVKTRRDRRDRAASATSRASSSAARATTSSSRLNGHPAAGLAVKLAPGAERARRPPSGVKATRRPSSQRSMPAGLEGHAIPFDTTHVHRALDRGGRQDADRGDRARRARDVRLPAELARDADPGRSRCRSCCSARSACSRSLGYSINTLTHVRHGAVDRPARRRRDRRRRERRAPDAREQPVAARGDDPLDGARSPAR